MNEKIWQLIDGEFSAEEKSKLMTAIEENSALKEEYNIAMALHQTMPAVTVTDAPSHLNSLIMEKITNEAIEAEIQAGKIFTFNAWKIVVVFIIFFIIISLLGIMGISSDLANPYESIIASLTGMNIYIKSVLVLIPSMVILFLISEKSFSKDY